MTTTNLIIICVAALLALKIGAAVVVTHLTQLRASRAAVLPSPSRDPLPVGADVAAHLVSGAGSLRGIVESDDGQNLVLHTVRVMAAGQEQAVGGHVHVTGDRLDWSQRL